MRQLDTMSSATARRLADYLLTLGIKTQLMDGPAGCAVWVCDEDRVAQARQEYADFQKGPDEPRFSAAARAAEDIRTKARREEEAYQRRDRRFHRRMQSPRQPLTVAIVLACSIISLITWERPSGRPLEQALLIAPYTVTRDGIRWDWLNKIGSGQLWRLVTPIFLHFGIWHLLFDMVMFFRLGGPIEQRRGWWRLLALILIIAVVSNVAQYYLGHFSFENGAFTARPDPYFGGMSGVVYGLFGYVWMKFYYEPELGLSLQPSTVLFMVVWLLLCATQEFQEVVGRVANVAHGAGLATGLILGAAPVAGRALWRRLRGE